MRQFLSASLIGFLVLGACSRRAREAPEFKQLAARRLFDNRALQAQRMRVNQLLNSTGNPMAARALDQYQDIVNRALIIRTDDVLTHSDFQILPQQPLGPWSFPILIGNALGVVGYGGSTEAAMQNLSQALTTHTSNFNQRWLDVDPQRGLSVIPLTLLAVVNRLDLMRTGTTDCPTDMYCGAEFRFVYAGVIEDSTNAPHSYLTQPYFTLILEFVLPPLPLQTLRDMSGDWMSLAAISNPDDHREALKTTLTKAYQQWASSERPLARIRTNSRAGAAGPWNFDQFLFANSGFVQVPLDQQFQVDISTCVTSSSLMGKFLNDPQTQNKVLKADYNFFSPSDTCPVGGLASCDGEIIIPPAGPLKVLTLNKAVAPQAKSVDDIRYALSINSCTGCHGFETQGGTSDTTDPLYQYTPFDQIKYEPGQPSRLSRFLAGGPGGLPTLTDGGWQVSPTPVVANCGPDPEPRAFNDLFRRLLFHQFLTSPIGYPWVYFDSSGLAATQSH